ncbi:hypothetical protein SERLA73DRAFT_129210, partial [Serpula lacrymans var. lacrymans S7.3]
MFFIAKIQHRYCGRDVRDIHPWTLVSGGKASGFPMPIPMDQVGQAALDVEDKLRAISA